MKKGAKLAAVVLQVKQLVALEQVAHCGWHGLQVAVESEYVPAGQDDTQMLFV